MTLGVQDVYSSAASVQSQTGVDPAIIAVIASTESNLNLSPPFTLGITSQATRGGIGSSGGILSSPNNYGGTQPSAFFSYQSGAEAAFAFRDYIQHYQSGLAPLLGSALDFFNPNGPIRTSNYYVPTAGESARAGSAAQATYNYYQTWLNRAAGLVNGQPVGQDSAPVSTPGISTERKEDRPSGFTPPTGGPGQGPLQLDFGGSAYHVLVSIGLVLLALVFVLGGIWLLTSSKDLNVPITIGEAPGSHERGYSRGVIETAHEFGHPTAEAG
jgi:hypothetical protein